MINRKKEHSMNSKRKKIAIVVAVIIVVVLVVIGIVIGIHYFQSQPPSGPYDYDSNTCTYPKTKARESANYDETVANSNVQTNENSNAQTGISGGGSSIPSDDNMRSAENTSNQIRALAASQQSVLYNGVIIDLDVDTLASVMSKIPELQVSADADDYPIGTGEDIVEGMSVSLVEVVDPRFPGVEEIMLDLYNDSDTPKPAFECKVGGFGITYADQGDRAIVIFPGGFDLSTGGNSAKAVYGEPTSIGTFDEWLAENPDAVLDGSENRNEVEFYYENDNDSSLPAIFFDFSNGIDRPCQEGEYGTAKYHMLWKTEMERGGYYE